MINPILSPKQPVLRHVIDDAPVAIVVMYVGDEASATITVSTDITFKHGDAAAEAADDTIDSGGDDAGEIDITDTNADTLGEVVDLINASANWKAYIKDGLRGDDSDGLLARAETTLTPNVTETPLYSDTSTELNLTLRIGSRTKVNGTEENSAAEVYRITSTNTYGSGYSYIQIYEVDEIKKTETKIYEQDGGATATEQKEQFQDDDNGAVAVSRTGMHLVARIIGETYCTGKMSVAGAVARGA